MGEENNHPFFSRPTLTPSKNAQHRANVLRPDDTNYDSGGDDEERDELDFSYDMVSVELQGDSNVGDNKEVKGEDEDSKERGNGRQPWLEYIGVKLEVPPDDEHPPHSPTGNTARKEQLARDIVAFARSDSMSAIIELPH